MSKERVSIVTDSTCDLPQEIIEKYDIGVAPVDMSFGNEAITIDASFSLDKFLTELKTNPIHPTTAAASPSKYVGVYQEKPGNIISIHLGSGYSQVYNNSVLAAKELPERNVTTIDSESLSLGLGFMAWEAAFMAQQGHDVPTIKTHVEDLVRRTSVFASMNTLDYAIKGGRISKIEGRLGSMLSIKPILKFQENDLDTEKIRTRKKSLARMLEIAKTSGPLERVGVVHSGEGADKHAGELADRISEFFDGTIVYGEITPVIVVHSGPATVGMILVRGKQN